MKRKLFLIVCVVFAIGLCACSSNKGSINQEAKSAIENGLKQLSEMESTYLVATTHEAPDGVLNYIEIQSEGNSYTEYPLDSDGNIGTIPFGQDANTQYLLYDWLTKDNKYYSVTSDDSQNIVYYSLPDAYAGHVSSRKVMYMDYMIKHFTSIEEYDSKTADIGNGDEVFKVYKCKLPAENVKYILGMGSYSIYDSIEADTEDKNIKTLCKYYKQELDTSLTFSDATVLVGISDDGMLKYINIEVGGLGSRMYVTKCIITDDGISTRTKPDVSDAVKFETTLKETADYISTFDSYDDAIKAMNNEDSTEAGLDTQEANTEPTPSEETSEVETSTENTSSEEDTSTENTSEESTTEESTTSETGE